MQRISSGSSFERSMGYSRAVIDTDYVHVAGTTGYDYATMRISADPAEQAEQCLRNIQSVLEQAGTSMANVVRVNYIFPNRDDFEPCWPIFKKYFGTAPPAATMIVAGLYDIAMKLEIEVTARVENS
ncbi:MAG: RidA family protein [Gammaproteobacteria bacterium]|nr:RidA family protein [Gammaproteobacteria bacterium]